MKVSARIAVCAATVGMAGVAVAGCAPSTSTEDSGKDEKTGTVRVWLFKEVGNAPKQRVVDGVVERFEKKHKGVTVDVRYIPIDSRAERIKGAFNDRGSAPDVIEYGNTDTAGYVADGGLADVSEEFKSWPAADDIDATAKKSVTYDGRTYGAPLFVGVRALYYRTDVFEELGLKPPKTLGQLTETARQIRKERPKLYGLAVGGAYTYGAMPFIWAKGGDLADERGGEYAAALDSPEAKKGIKAYTDLLDDSNCPPARCSQWGGNETVEAFAGGRAGMAIAGDFNRQAMEDGEVKGDYGVVPLPGEKSGEIAPAFAGGNNVGVLKSSSHRTLAVELMKELAGKRAQEELFDAMGFLPTFTDTRRKVAEREPFVKPFVETLDAGTEFVPVSPAWGEIDASLVLPGMFQEIAGGKKNVDAAAEDAAKKMDKVYVK